jgi:hypothetical protein
VQVVKDCEFSFVPKRDEVAGEWRKFHNGEFHNLYSSPDIIRQFKSRRMRWAGHVARMGDHLEDQGIDGRMGSKRTRGDWLEGCRVDSPGSG